MNRREAATVIVLAGLSIWLLYGCLSVFLAVAGGAMYP